ncbi:MAG: hypothetical protein SGJ05_09360 [bacterium]|nr:hypothetical protein [bacterium]
MSTYEAYQGNGNRTRYFPVETWGKAYRVFSAPQDEYNVSPNLQRRAGQIVVVASENSTVVTIKSPVAIAANAAIGTRIAPTYIPHTTPYWFFRFVCAFHS